MKIRYKKYRTLLGYLHSTFWVVVRVHISLKVTHLFRAKVTSLNEVNLSA